MQINRFIQIIYLSTGASLLLLAKSIYYINNTQIQLTSIIAILYGVILVKRYLTRLKKLQNRASELSLGMMMLTQPSYNMTSFKYRKRQWFTVL